MSEKFNKGSIVTATLLVFGILILIAALAFTFHNPVPQEASNNNKSTTVTKKDVVEEDKNSEEFYLKIKNVALSFVGSPYLLNPTDEENIYNEEGFDSTSFILSVIAVVHNPNNPEEIIKEINYYPAGAVSLLNRNHFSTYRNKVSPYFTDITSETAEDLIKEKTLVLNKKQEDGSRLIDINWEESIIINYIEREDVTSIIDKLPLLAGVMFLYHEDAEMGLDVRQEGVIIDNKEIIYSSSTAGEIVKRDFQEYVVNGDFDGAIFYRINKQ